MISDEKQVRSWSSDIWHIHLWIFCMHWEHIPLSTLGLWRQNCILGTLPKFGALLMVDSYCIQHGIVIQVLESAIFAIVFSPILTDLWMPVPVLTWIYLRYTFMWQIPRIKLPYSYSLNVPVRQKIGSWREDGTININKTVFTYLRILPPFRPDHAFADLRLKLNELGNFVKIAGWTVEKRAVS